MKKTFLILFSAALLLTAGLPALQAEDLGAVRTRMEQRLGEVDALKAQGALGENNRGFLEVRDGGGNAVTVVADENRDREAVYAEIANRTGSSAAAVGKARARQIAAGSAPGVWVQKEDGAWIKK